MNVNDEYNLEKPRYNKYTCKARIGTLEELLTQPQVEEQIVELQDSEGELDVRENNAPEVGRENDEKLEVKNRNHDNKLNENTDFDLNENILGRKILDAEKVGALDKISQKYNDEPLNLENRNYKVDPGMLWHIRLGHASLGYLRRLQKSLVELRSVKFHDSILDCEVCVLAKMKKLPFRETRTRAERPLQRVHCDTMGAIKPTSFPGGNKFITVFVDDYSRFAKMYCSKTKDNSGPCLERYLITTRNLLGKNEKLCYIRSDRGTEFTGGKFLEIMQIEGIEPEVSPPHTQEHNGVAERFNESLQVKTRSLMIDSGLPKTMWPLAAEVSVHVYNRTPHSSIEFEIPLKKFSGMRNVHLDKIRRFGCLAYMKIPIKDTKFSDRAIRTILVGYSTTGYILWHPPSGKLLNSRHVKFNEKVVYKNAYKKDIHDEIKELEGCEDRDDLADENWLTNLDLGSENQNEKKNR